MALEWLSGCHCGRVALSRARSCPFALSPGWLLAAYPVQRGKGRKAVPCGVTPVTRADGGSPSACLVSMMSCFASPRHPPSPPPPSPWPWHRLACGWRAAPYVLCTLHELALHLPLTSPLVLFCWCGAGINQQWFITRLSSSSFFPFGRLLTSWRRERTTHDWVWWNGHVNWHGYSYWFYTSSLILWLRNDLMWVLIETALRRVVNVVIGDHYCALRNFWFDSGW